MFFQRLFLNLCCIIFYILISASLSKLVWTMILLSPTEEASLLFLNFRGEELRYNFVSHLTDSLKRHKINVFVDNYELRGEDLTNLFVRIEQSEIALAIFSTRYAESRWCMDELVKMKKLVDQGKLRVIPIFYKVRAEDVKKQNGEFGDKFWELARNSTGDQIKNWKEALECICNKMGLSLTDQSSEADFIKSIVTEVQRVVSAIGLNQEKNHFGGRKRKDRNRKCELPDFKKSKTENLDEIKCYVIYTLILISFLVWVIFKKFWI